MKDRIEVKFQDDREMLNLTVDAEFMKSVFSNFSVEKVREIAEKLGHMPEPMTPVRVVTKVKK